MSKVVPTIQKLDHSETGPFKNRSSKSPISEWSDFGSLLYLQIRGKSYLTFYNLRPKVKQNGSILFGFPTVLKQNGLYFVQDGKPLENQTPLETGREGFH